MLATHFKRALIWSLPALLAVLAIQYHRTGKIGGSAVAIMLLVLAAMYFASNGVNHLWFRTFGTGRAAVNGLAVLWAVVAICLLVYFCQLT
jgi:hypothetical protein